jgi:hypothetical protein
MSSKAVLASACVGLGVFAGPEKVFDTPEKAKIFKAVKVNHKADPNKDCEAEVQKLKGDKTHKLDSDEMEITLLCFAKSFGIQAGKFDAAKDAYRKKTAALVLSQAMFKELFGDNGLVDAKANLADLVAAIKLVIPRS